MLSLREFAKIAKVSPMTVSRVFSDNPRVAEKTRQRILELAEKYEFRPSAVMPSARTGITKSVGVIYPHHDNSYFYDIFRGIQEELIDKNFLPIILGARGPDFEKHFNRLIDHRIDGIIVTTYTKDLEKKVFEQCQKLKISTVFIGTKPPKVKSDSISSDNKTGGEIAADYLLKMGHQKIGLLKARKENAIRDEYFLKHLSKNGINIPEKHILSLFENSNAPEPDYLKFKTELEQFLSSPDCPDAIFASTDPLALYVYQAAGKLGIKIPDELSVIGYGSTNVCETIWPPLTSIKQDGYTEGKTAADLIIERINGDNSEIKNLSIPVRLDKRMSVKNLN
jgi:LacI family transcriptional regulator